MTAPVRVQVWDETQTTLIATLSDVVAAGGLDQLDGNGTGHLTVLRSNPGAAHLVAGRIIAVAVRSTSGGWVPAHSWVLERPVDTIVSTREFAGAAVQWTGRGTITLLEKSPIVARQAAPYAPELRYDWSAPEVSAATWAAPHQRNIQGAVGTTPPDGYGGVPWQYPNPLARSLWPVAPLAGPPAHDAPGWAIFDAVVTLAGNERIHSFPAGDDTISVAIDGTVIRAETDTAATAMGDAAVRTTDLPAGTHTVRVLVENVDRPAIAANSGAMYFSLARDIVSTVFGGSHRILDWLLTTSTTGAWKALLVTDPANMPGLTPGAMWADLVAKAHGRGELPGVTVAGTGAADHTGVAWPGPIPGKVFAAGRTLLEVRDELAGEGWCHLRMAPDSLQLRPTVHPGGTAAAVIAVGVNAAALEDTGDSSGVLDGIEATWRYGSVRVGTGPRVGSMSTDAETAGEATRLATAQLAALSAASEGRTLSWRPDTDATTPFVGFTVGDTITGPSGPVQTTSIGWELAADSITWAVEVDTPRTVAADLADRVRRRSFPGSLGGRSDLVAPATPTQPAASTLRGETLTFAPQSDPPVIGQMSPPMTLSAPGVVQRARLSCADASGSTGPTTFALRINGAASLWSFTLPTGATEHWDTALVIVGDTNIAYTLGATAVGGHTGVNVELIASLLP